MGHAGRSMSIEDPEASISFTFESGSTYFMRRTGKERLALAALIEMLRPAGSAAGLGKELLELDPLWPPALSIAVDTPSGELVSVADDVSLVGWPSCSRVLLHASMPSCN